MWQFWLILERLFLPAWRQNKFPDPNHPWRRTFTSGYRRKKEVVVWLWYGCTIGILLLSTIAWMVILLLLTTFISFSILDETD